MNDQQPNDLVMNGCLAIIKAVAGFIVGFVGFLLGVGQFLRSYQTSRSDHSMTFTDWNILAYILGAVIVMIFVVISRRIGRWKAFTLGVLMGRCVSALLAGACADWAGSR